MYNCEKLENGCNAVEDEWQTYTMNFCIRPPVDSPDQKYVSYQLKIEPFYNTSQTGLQEFEMQPSFALKK